MQTRSLDTRHRGNRHATFDGLCFDDFCLRDPLANEPRDPLTRRFTKGEIREFLKHYFRVMVCFLSNYRRAVYFIIPFISF